jgi:hypothetical protein
LPPISNPVRPTLFIERDPNNGPTYIRVLEQVHNPFGATAPQRTICNATNATFSDPDVEGNFTYLIANVDTSQRKYGVNLLRTDTTMIYDFTFTDWQDNSAHGGGIKIGDSGNATIGATFVQRVFADGMLNPDPTYNLNVDFLGIELNSGPLYFRDVTGRNFADAGIDTKSGPVYIMNATFDSANRMLRAWEGVEITIVNSIVNCPAGCAPPPPGENNPELYSQLWIADDTSAISYYNTLWCQDADEPSASHPDCRTTPWIIEGEDMDQDEVQARIFQLNSNPLPSIHPFFQTQVEKIVLQYSSDNGATWQDMVVPNTGGPGSAPVGDPRYRIPLNLGSANYRFRAWYERNGAKIGDTSAVIDESGNIVP